MDKKRALICSIFLYAIGIITFTVYLVGSVILKTFPPKLGTFLPIMFVMFLLGGAIMTVVFLRLKKQENTTTVSPYVKPDIDEEEFREWLVNFEPFAKIAKKLNVTTDKTFSKFGGLPQTPQNFEWPSVDGRPTPFLLQIDFSEINKEGILNDFPTSGLLYLFADEEDINNPTFENGEEPYVQGRTFQVLFFEESDELITPSKSDALELIYKEFHVTAEAVKTYPDAEECTEIFDIYCGRPVGGLDDEYDFLQGEHMDSTLIGGWASYIQGKEILRDCEDDQWVLLMQITSYFDKSWDNNIMWGDAGNIYLFIRKTDLKARNFNNVKFDMQCT